MEISVHNLELISGITKKNIKDLITNISKQLDLEMMSCQVIFTNDEKLRSMHEKYLNDPDYTDVMTFNLGEDKIEGEIYISVDRVKENAKIFNVSMEVEIIRNIIHGLLHLRGYNDKEVPEKVKMKQKENELLNLYQGF